MKIVNTVRPILISVALIGLVTSLFLSGLYFGLEQATQVRSIAQHTLNGDFSDGGNGLRADVSLRHALIGLCIGLVLIAQVAIKRIALSLLGVIPALAALLQSLILLGQKPAWLLVHETGYSHILAVFWYLDFVAPLTAVTILSLYVFVFSKFFGDRKNRLPR